MVRIALLGQLERCRPGSPVDLVDVAHELDVDALELTDAPSLDEAALGAIRSRCDAAGIEIVSLHLAVSPDVSDPVRIAGVRDGLKRAAMLGAGMVAVYVQPIRPDDKVEEMRDVLNDVIAAALTDAERLGVVLTCNNSGNYPAHFGDVDYFVALCEDFAPHLRVTLDPANCPLAGEDPLGAIERLAPHVRMVHLKDWVPAGSGSPSAGRSLRVRLERAVMAGPAGGVLRAASRRFRLRRFVPHVFHGLDGSRRLGAVIGDGVFDVGGVLRTLDNVGYTGTVSIEYEGSGDLDDAYRRGVAHVRTLIAER